MGRSKQNSLATRARVSEEETGNTALTRPQPQCDCRRSRHRQRSQSSSSATSFSQSSPGTVESRVTTPGGLLGQTPPGTFRRTTSPGKLEPLSLNVTNAFFAFVGDSPSPLTDVFSQSFLRTYLETSVPVRAIVSAIGRIRLEFEGTADLATKQAAAASIIAGDRSLLNQYLDILTAPDYHDQHITLLFGILFAYAEASSILPVCILDIACTLIMG